MMHFNRGALWAFFAAVAILPGQDLVAVLPATGNADTAVRLLNPRTLEPVVTALPANLAADIKQIIPMPGVSKYFLVARNSTPVSVLDGVSGDVHSISGGINLAATTAIMIPDASRLAVAAGRVYFFNATTEGLDNSAGVEIQGQIVDLAATFDSSRLLVLSQSDAGEIIVTSIDLATETIANTLKLPGATDAAPGGMTIGPNSLVYVSGFNHVYEIDPRTCRLTKGGDILLPGTPGKATASPDGRYLILANLRPGSSPAALYQITVANKLPGVSNSLGADIFSTFAPQRFVTGFEGMFGFTRSGHLYDVRYGSTPSFSASYADAFFGEGGVAHPVYLSAAFSNEWYPQRLAITKASGDQVALYSVDVTSGELQRAALPNQPWRVALVTPSALTGALRMLQYNTAQIVPAGGRTTLPLVVRLIEPYAHGVYGAPITFTSSTPGVSIETSSVLSGVDGFAQTYVTAGDTAGPFTVIASSPGVPDVTFTLTVPSTPNGADLSGLFIVSGNGQVIRELSKTSAPMTIELRDLNGNPVANEPVTWALRDGVGDVLPVSFRTDANGRATANFRASGLTISQSYAQAIVEAATSSGKVTFYLITTPNLIPGRGQAPDPTVIIVYPDFNVTRTFNGRVGGVIKNAIGVKVIVSVGPQTGFGIPNVGLSVTTAPPATATDDPAPLPGFTASCPGAALSDADGFINCDLIIGSRTGSGVLYMNAGGFRDLPRGQLNVTLGDPGKVLVVVGSNQTARVQAPLPTPLTARVTDLGNNVLQGVTVNWTVTRGAAVLSDSKVATDSNGNSTIHVQLGAIPGPVTIRASVGDSIFALFTLTATVTFGGISRVSGDGQSAFTSVAFENPLAVMVRDDQGQIVPGVPVQFTATGPVVLSSTSAVTDAQGVARLPLNAGASFGPAVVTASIPGFSTTFNLRVLPRTPVIDNTSFSSAASLATGLTPCGLSAITGTAMAPGVVGILQSPPTPPLPYSLGPVDGVTLGGVPAPIVSVSNSGGVEQVIVQSPCELNGPITSAVVRVTGLDAATVNGIPVTPIQPGIFEYVADDGLRYANALRADGQVQGPSNPVKRGTNVQLMVTGLGQVSPRALTNVAGADGQTVDAPIIVGLNDTGVPVVRAVYKPGTVGTYIVEVTIPDDAPAGSRNTVTVAVQMPDGTVVYSPVSYLVIE